jgi:dTDP-4-dehydrorhamnose 3,5-epimerase
MSQHAPFLKSGTLIDGVDLRGLDMHRDSRGHFTEVFRHSWKTAISPTQWSVVESVAGTLRGMHLHRRHDEYFLVLQGHSSVGLKDVRPGSPTEGAWALYDLHGDELACLSFPRGILHGWYFHEPSLHLQAVSEDYGAYGEDDNLGCHWSDPELGIPWPAEPLVVAERANSFPGLEELLEKTRALSAAGEPWFETDKDDGHAVT